MHKGPVGPNSGRTGRSQAERIGTDPSGFKDGPAYDYKAGVPTSVPGATQEYKSMSEQPPAGGGQQAPPAPFTLTTPKR